nr:hypothetical protein [Streptomyces agglomeratus]
MAALQARRSHQSGDAAASADSTLAFQHGLDAWSAVGATRLGVDLGDLPGQFRVMDRPRTGLAGAAGAEGGSGDLEQFTCALDVVTVLLLRLDERVHRHRLSFAKKAVLDSTGQGNALGWRPEPQALARTVVELRRDGV